jgi:hypothetical protein
MLGFLGIFLLKRNKYNVSIHVECGGRNSVSGYRFQKKVGAIAALVLCLGVAIVPWGASGVITASIQRDDIEVMTQVYGIKGFGTHSVSLTEQQYQRLEQYLVDLQARLHTTVNKGEMVVLFNEAIVEIDTYGLLPRGLGVTQAQRLIMGSFQDSTMRPFRGIDGQSGEGKRFLEDVNPKLKNAFCVLSAEATKIPDHDPKPVILPFGLLLLFGLLPAFLASLLGDEELANSLAEVGLRVWNSNPFRMFNFVMILGYEVELRSVGLKGIVNEKISDGVVFRGYSGLLLFPFDDKAYFLGTAIDVVSSG